MAQQKSENRVVPKGRRKSSPTQALEQPGGGKAVPVKEADEQLLLGFVTAESPRVKRGTEGATAVELSTARTHEVPKAKPKLQPAGPATMEEVVGCLDIALDKVAANRGAPGPDRRTIEQVRKHWHDVRRELHTALQQGTYQPGDIRRVWIPKTGGGERGLGIPDVVDRVVQEAVRMVLEPLYEPTFHRSSHGFRPSRSCHTAIAEACIYVETGYAWVVDIDLKQFFDRVHHQRLMSKLTKRVQDKQLLTLIGRMLKAKVVMPDGVKVPTDEGVPQGGPLSPLLSNIVLDELDQELDRRGHRFVRYADDVNVYVRSERAGQRVMASVTQFIEKRMRLTVSAEKSAVAHPEARHFLGFSLLPQGAEPPGISLSKRSETRLRQRIRELTPRSRGESLHAVITRINGYLKGWTGFFGICTRDIELVLQGADAHIRRRLRAIVLHHWKTKRTIARRLIRLGVSRRTAWRRVYAGRKSQWALSHDQAVDRGLRNAYFAERGLVSLLAEFRRTWATISASRQLCLPWDTARSSPGRRRESQPAAPKSRM